MNTDSRSTDDDDPDGDNRAAQVLDAARAWIRRHGQDPATFDGVKACEVLISMAMEDGDGLAAQYLAEMSPEECRIFCGNWEIRKVV